MRLHYFILFAFVTGFFLFSFREKPKPQARVETKGNSKPNILFVIADDQSFPHASAYGSTLFKTPAFDAVAAKGVLFLNAFVAAPQCSPSRAAILTGKNIWQLEEAGTHSSYFPKKFPVFTSALENAGYAIGYTGKAWDPGNWKDAGWSRNPVGQEFNERKLSATLTSGISKIDYAENFRSFLGKRTSDQPFFFWFGSHEPHRVYEKGSGRRAGLTIDDKEIPDFLPKTDVVRDDMLDYALEVNWFDRQLGQMLKILEEKGELDNTIVIVTADNGMAFPYAKANVQEYGTHVPLAICGPGINGGSRQIKDLVSLIDLAPSILELAHAEPLAGTTGKSLMSIFKSKASGYIDSSRQYVLTGRERHTHARPDNLGYPARAIRDNQFLYIQNLKPDRWPAGDPASALLAVPATEKKPKQPAEGYEDIDASPTKTMMLENPNAFPRFFDLGFGKRNAEQLFDVSKDPGCTRDLASDKKMKGVVKRMKTKLDAELKQQQDPRSVGKPDVFESYPRFGAMRSFPGFNKQGAYNPAFTPPSPNFIFILTDDLGWSSLSVPMDDRLPASASDYHETPNIAKLAYQGLRFTRGYAPDPICSPTRRSIQFGQSSIHQGEDSFAVRYGSTNNPYKTIPQVLKSIDPRYKAAHFGKWDLRIKMSPEKFGYDLSDGDTGNGEGNAVKTAEEKWQQHTNKTNPKQIDSLTVRSIRFLQQRAADKHPFYLQVSHYATHANMETRQESFDKFKTKKPGQKHNNPAWAGMIHDLDRGIGELLDQVEQLGLSHNTYIVLMADNGAVEFIPPVSNRLDHPSIFPTPMRNHPLRGGKWTLYEGGIRVPFIVKGPGILPGQSSVPVIGWDLLPTFAALAGSNIPSLPDVDGGDITPLLKGDRSSQVKRSTSAFYFHRFNNNYPHSAIIKGNFKLIHFWKTGKAELYDLASDIGETTDISAQHKAKADELDSELLHYIEVSNPSIIEKYKK